MNIQKPEPSTKGDGTLLDVHSVFFTIQGEGPYSGHRSVFVRLAGCNLQCPGCDTEYTEGREEWKVKHLAQLVTQTAKDNGAPHCLVVITGGEPLRQPIGLLCMYLLNNGHSIQVESNGVLEPDPLTQNYMKANLVVLIVSPKTVWVHPTNRRLAAAFKYVLDHRSVSEKDGLPIQALEHPAAKGVARPEPNVPIYINPYDAGDPDTNALNLQAAADSCRRFGYILGVQLHKLVGVA